MDGIHGFPGLTSPSQGYASIKFAGTGLDRESNSESELSYTRTQHNTMAQTQTARSGGHKPATIVSNQKCPNISEQVVAIVMKSMITIAK